MNFTPTNSALVARDPEALSLAGYLDDLNMDALVARFPEAKVEAYWEPERGYDYPWELFFLGENDTVFYVYARHGEPRFGANDKGQAYAEDFKSFIMGSV